MMTCRKLYLLVFWLLVVGGLTAQSITVASWNIAHLGKTKSAEEIVMMARIINQYDVIGIQEVTAKDPGGAKAVAKIADELNRMGDRWDYRVSDPTRSSSGHLSERYAYFWRASKITFLRAGLDGKLAATVEREPYWLEIKVKGMAGTLWLTNFHSRPHDQQPEKEIVRMTDYPLRGGSIPLVMLGDWNLDEDHPVWEPFKQLGYYAALRATPTTLKQRCRDGNYRNYAIDNIYYPVHFLELVKSGLTDFINGRCEELSVLRHLSDHLPVWAEFKLATTAP